MEGKKIKIRGSLRRTFSFFRVEKEEGKKGMSALRDACMKVRLDREEGCGNSCGI